METGISIPRDGKSQPTCNLHRDSHCNRYIGSHCVQTCYENCIYLQFKNQQNDEIVLINSSHVSNAQKAFSPLYTEV